MFTVGSLTQARVLLRMLHLHSGRVFSDRAVIAEYGAENLGIADTGR